MNYQAYYDEEIDIGKEIPDLDENQKSSIKQDDISIDKKADSNSISKNEESLGSDTDISKSDELKDFSKKFIDPDKWKSLNVSQEIKECFQYIGKYVPQNVDIDYTLQPFIPDYVPAVGDVDAFLKVSCPECFDPNKSDKIFEMVKNLGLVVLDEPSGHQSEPSLLNMRLKSVLTSAKASSIQTPIAKSDRDIQKWISEIEQLHISQTRRSTVNFRLPNIDLLMAEWPQSFEQTLNRIGFPPYNIDCSLETYIRIICALFDIPIFENTQYHYINAVHTLFNLFLATNNTNE